MSNPDVIARSASDRTDDWPFWMVWDGTQNVTVEVYETVTGKPWPFIGPFLPRLDAETLVEACRQGTRAGGAHG